MQSLLAVLDGLLVHGSTVVVVEHDRDLIAQRQPCRRRQARLPCLPCAPDQADALYVAWERAEAERVEIACSGGYGRTGTAMACLAVLDGLPGRQGDRLRPGVLRLTRCGDALAAPLRRPLPVALCPHRSRCCRPVSRETCPTSASPARDGPSSHCRLPRSDSAEDRPAVSPPAGGGATPATRHLPDGWLHHPGTPRPPGPSPLSSADGAWVVARDCQASRQQPGVAALSARVDSSPAGGPGGRGSPSPGSPSLLVGTDCCWSGCLRDGVDPLPAAMWW